MSSMIDDVKSNLEEWYCHDSHATLDKILDPLAEAVECWEAILELLDEDDTACVGIGKIQEPEGLYVRAGGGWSGGVWLGFGEPTFPMALQAAVKAKRDAEAKQETRDA